MKSIAHPILAILALCVAPAFSEESNKADSSPGQAHVDIGPISVSVAVAGHGDGKASKTAYLGVVTAAVPPQLRAQLDLPEGMGLSVEAVAKGSPSDTAGIKQYDVLKKFNDQMLCAQEQLSVLVKAAGKDANVSLVLLRGGREQNLSVVLGEHDAPEGAKAQFSINGVPGVSIEVRDLDKIFTEGFTGSVVPEILNHALGGGAKAGSAGIQQNWDEMRRKNQQRQKEIEAQIDGAMDKARDAAKKAREASEQAGAAAGRARAQVFSFYPKGQSQSVVTVADGDGSVEVTDANGKRTVKVKDPSGQEIHSGPLNNEADHDAVPEKFRAKVKDAESKIKPPGDGQLKKKPEKEAELPKAPGGAI